MSKEEVKLNSKLYIARGREAQLALSWGFPVTHTSSPHPIITCPPLGHAGFESSVSG